MCVEVEQCFEDSPPLDARYTLPNRTHNRRFIVYANYGFYVFDISNDKAWIENTTTVFGATAQVNLRQRIPGDGIRMKDTLPAGVGASNSPAACAVFNCASTADSRTAVDADEGCQGSPAPQLIRPPSSRARGRRSDCRTAVDAREMPRFNCGESLHRQRRRIHPPQNHS